MIYLTVAWWRLVTSDILVHIVSDNTLSYNRHYLNQPGPKEKQPLPLIIGKLGLIRENPWSVFNRTNFIDIWIEIEIFRLRKYIWNVAWKNFVRPQCVRFSSVTVLLAFMLLSQLFATHWSSARKLSEIGSTCKCSIPSIWCHFVQKFAMAINFFIPFTVSGESLPDDPFCTCLSHLKPLLLTEISQQIFNLGHV